MFLLRVLKGLHSIVRFRPEAEHLRKQGKEALSGFQLERPLWVAYRRVVNRPIAAVRSITGLRRAGELIILSVVRNGPTSLALSNPVQEIQALLQPAHVLQRDIDAALQRLLREPGEVRRGDDILQA